jgi:(p)ppGpp synthase/HD superfamily hydrolase
MPAYSAVLDRALALAASAHREQVRKGTSVPYIIHPVHAAMILLKYQFPEETAVAAVLHDVVEDTTVPLSTIEAEFGVAVARIVDDVSERKVAGDKKLPWRERKQEQIARLQQAEATTAAVKAADALHNCQSMLRDLAAQGSELWRRFRGSQEDQLWYYTSLAALLRRRLGGHPICDELDTAVAALADWHKRESVAESQPKGKV